jgi:hypothetical protein
LSGRWQRNDAHSKSTGMCKSSGETGGAGCYQPPDLKSVGIDDKFGFNEGAYIWKPYSCNIKIYSKLELQQCFVKKNIRKIAFTGDSLLREHYQNMMSLFFDAESRKDATRQLKFPIIHYFNSSYRVNASYEHTVHFTYFGMAKLWGNLKQQKFDAHLWSLSIIRYMVNQVSEKELKKWVGGFFNSTAYKIRAGRQESSVYTYYLHPRVQFEDRRVDRDLLTAALLATEPDARSVSNLVSLNPHPLPPSAASLQVMAAHKTKFGFYSVTADRYQSAIDTLRPLLAHFNMESLDGSLVSDSRWEATWDGVHYSLMVPAKDDEARLISATKEGGDYGKSGRKAIAPSYQVASRRADLLKLENDTIGLGHRSKDADCLLGYAKSGHALCPRIRQVTGLNKCVGSQIYWCHDVVAGKSYSSFEGGVSMMLTMLWLNRLCN